MKPSSARGVSKRFRRALRRNVDLNYLLYLPRRYSKGKKWPLLLFLHGLGERGDDPRKIAIYGPPKRIEDGAEFPFIVAAPQCRTGEWWCNEPLIGWLDHLCRTHSVDERRIYLTGLSMGGFGAWSLALAYPERFAAVAPLCAGGLFAPAYGFNPQRAKALKRLPFWIFHGAHDDVIDVKEGERMIRALKAFGGNGQFTVYPKAGHDCWTETYANPELYKWFLSHRLK